MKTVKIYTLSDPRTNLVRYVGKTTYSLNDRLCKHMLTEEKNHRGNWIRGLKALNLRPIIELLEEVDELGWQQSEIYWIEQFRHWGFNLVNIGIGGESGIISEQCRAASIKSNTGVKHSNEHIENRISKLKKPVILNHKNGQVFEFSSASEAARELKLCMSHVTECCNGKRKTHKNYTITYKN